MPTPTETERLVRESLLLKGFTELTKDDRSVLSEELRNALDLRTPYPSSMLCELKSTDKPLRPGLQGFTLGVFKTTIRAVEAGFPVVFANTEDYVIVPSREFLRLLADKGRIQVQVTVPKGYFPSEWGS